jgi:hypothetical protein
MPDRAPARPEEALEELRGWASDGKPVTEYGADTYPGLHAQPPPPPGVNRVGGNKKGVFTRDRRPNYSSASRGSARSQEDGSPLPGRRPR